MVVCFQTLYKNAYFVSTYVLTTPENGRFISTNAVCIHVESIVCLTKKEYYIYE